MRHLPLVLICAVSTLATADADKSSAKVGAGGAVKFHVARTFVDGTPLVNGAMTLPAGWRYHGTSFETLTFVPKTAKYDRPSISIAVRNDNLDPSKVAATARTRSNEFKTRIVGGGTLVKTITDSHELTLGGPLHGLAASFEIDATADRHVHYVQTECYVWSDNQPYIVSYVGFAEMPDAALVPDFEKACSSITLATK